MALIQNDIGPVSLRGLISTTVVVVVIVATGFLLWKYARRVLFPAPVDATKCKDDPNYEYKDPANHPNDC